MADPRTLVEGSLKYRDGRKWKSRWCVVSKLSPVADCLHLQLYRDSKDRCKNGPTKASLSLEGFLGMETGFTLDKESNTLALICTEVVVVLAFDSRELLIQWQVKIRTNLVEEQQFLVQVSHAPPKSKLSSGPARLHLQDYKFCLTAGVPPRLLGTWPIKELRRFGVVDGKYCFEGGSRCGRGEGIHILLTNQAEELAQSVDLASRGKLHGRRKYSRKHSVDPATRMSFLPKSHGRDSDKCSTESSKPLLSSGSDGSTCDAFSDSFRIDGMGEDLCNSKSNCHIHYHWPSCSYYRWTGTPATELPDLPTISDFQDQQQLSSVNSSMRNINGCPCESQSTWSFSHCSKCGGRYCMKESTRQIPDLRQTNGNVFAPHWTMDLTVVSPSSEVAVHGRKGVFRTSVKSPPDRSSLCSQSSQSSGTSSGSSSEYSVPRSCIDNLYDRPRSMHHINGHNLSRSPPRIVRGNSLDEEHKRLLGSGMKTPNQESFPACTCRFNVDIPKVHGMSYPCTCWTRTMPNLQKEASSGSGSSTGSPSSSPKHASRICGTLPSKRDVQALLPCTCRRNLTSNGHYSVPRSAIANIYLKERQLPLENGDSVLERNKMTDITPKEEYDVPKKLQEHCIQMNGHQDNEMCKPVLCTCNKNGTDNFQMHTTSNQVCTCQRVMWWAGNLVPCWRKDAGDEHLSLLDHGFVRSDSESSMCKQTQAVCREPPKLEFISETCAMHNGEEHPTQAKNTSNPNYVNLDFTNSGQDQSNYANIHFIEALPYYENVNCILAKLSEDDSCVHSELVKNQKSLKMSPSQVRKAKMGNYEFSGSVYELMSFPVAEEEEKLQRDDNYMVMQPVYPTKSQQSLSGVEDSDISEEEKRASEVERSDSTSLSLRPFMPYLLPCQSKGYETELAPRRKEQDLRSARSNSLSELKQKMLMRKRSNSADTRNESGLNDGSETDECPGSPSSCPRYASRKTSLFSKFTLRSKEKSFSANEITPPSSVPSTPNNDSLESLHRALYHRSADCLKHEENLFSDDELSRDYEDIKYKVECDFGCLGTSIKRSSSVPCKPSAEVSSITSPSDSGFSTSLPRSSGVSISPINNSHIVSIHNSLPRKHSLAKPEIATSLRKSKQDGEKSDRKCQKQKNNGKCRAGEYRRLMHAAASPENHLLLESKSVNTSSSSSDMSDYIETLSLCSRSSTSSGSSSDYVRSEELCSVSHKSTNILKPRAGREYDSAERLGVTSEKSNQEAEANVSVQYAVIDVVATAAAKKIGVYRSQQREEKNESDS